MIINNSPIKPYNYTLPAGRSAVSREDAAFGGKFGINIGTEYTISAKPYKFDKKLDSEMEKRLFPNGVENLTLYQGKMQSCASLAIIKALSLNKTGQKLLKRMIQVKPDGEIQVNFPNYPCLNLFPGNIETIRKNYNAGGDPAATALEEAYKTLRKNTVKHNLRLLLYNGRFTDNAVIKLGVPGSMALKDFTGLKIHGSTFLNTPVLKNDLDNISDNQEKMVAVAGTKNDIDKGVKLEGIDQYGDKRVFKIHARHAYSIVNVDKKMQEITLINPYNSNVRARISYDQFCKFFDKLNYVDMSKF